MGVPSPVPIVPRGSRTKRMSIRSHLIEACDILLPKNAPWLDEFRNELTAFTQGRYDDKVDAFAQLLGWVEDRRHGRMIATPT